jgi:hypothetical protein
MYVYVYINQILISEICGRHSGDTEKYLSYGMRHRAFL